MDTVVHFRQFALCRPSDELLLLFLKPLEFPDKIDLEFRADSHRELESNVLVSISSTVTPGFGNYADGVGLLRPFFSAEAEIVESRFTFNYVEFGRIKLGTACQKFRLITDAFGNPFSHGEYDLR